MLPSARPRDATALLRGRVNLAPDSDAGAEVHDRDQSVRGALVLPVRGGEGEEAWPQALAFLGSGDRGQYTQVSALNRDRGLRARLEVCEPRRILVVAGEGGCDEVAVSLPQVHERLNPRLAGAPANRVQQKNRMIEESGAEAAAAIDDGEALHGSRSPNDSLRRARDGSRVDPLEPFVETHDADHQYKRAGSQTRFLTSNQSPRCGWATQAH